MKAKKTIRAYAVFVKDKIKNVYEDEVEARCAADLERYMGYMGRSGKGLCAHVKSIRVRRITITVETGKPINKKR